MENLSIDMRSKQTKSPVESMEGLYFKHYDEQIAKHGPKTAILLQVGKFFEVYDSVDVSTGTSRANVQTLAEVCGCAVEPRTSSDPSKSRLFWGFPESSLPKFERLLVVAGYTTVVIVQNKDTSGNVISRTIDHISSPGTYWDVEGGLPTRRDEQCLVCVYIEPSAHGWFLASTAFDSMTGKLVSTEAEVPLINGRPVTDSLQPFWSRHPPAEAIVYWCSETPKPTSFPFFSKTVPTHIYQVDPKSENMAVTDRIRLALFSEIFQPSSALPITEYLDIGVFHFVRRSLYHLLQFVKDHTPSYLTALHEHRMSHPDDHVVLGNTALEQLGMLPVHEPSTESMLHWLQHAQTAMGKRCLRERCLTPIPDVEELNARQERIQYLRGTDAQEWVQSFRGIFDLARLFRRFQLGNGTTDTLFQMLQTYEKAGHLLEKTKGTPCEAEEPEWLAEHVRTLLSRWDSERIRANRKQVDQGVAIGSCHPWKRGIHTDLDLYEDSWNELEAEMLRLKHSLETSIQDSECITWTLKEDAPFTFTTTSRRGTQIESISKKSVKSVKRGTSTTITLDSEAIRMANEKALDIRGKWKAEVDRTWQKDWADWMAKESDQMKKLVEFLGKLDTECTFASLANKYGYVRPTYVESTEHNVAGVSVHELRHPIIERIHTGTSYIPHTLAFGAFHSPDLEGASNRCGMLLYGVNASGKSSLGKAIGLAVMMAQCGIPVPAKAMTLIPYTGIFTRILGNDNLWAGMSSFVVEMTEFRSIVRSAGPRSLVIGDELCAGTETASATAIVAAGVQTLAKRESHFFFATHLHELADIPEIANNPDIGFYHLAVHPDLEKGTLVYDRSLRKGCGSPMYGLEVCRGLDMDAEFLSSAFAFRKRFFGGNGKARPSRYNASVIVDNCTICGSNTDLETHHLVPQAQGRQLSPGKNVHSEENLAVLCEDCHTKHHRGLLTIQGWVQTTHGRVLKTVNNAE